MYKTDVQKKVFNTIDHETVYMDPKVQNHGKSVGRYGGTLVGGPF